MRVGNEKIIAIFCADIHLSLNAPIWRSAEPDWFEAMKRPLKEIKKLQGEYNCPVICAGDIFDRWNSPPELINWAYDNLPKMYAIPGQHDLPLHNYDDIKKSAYLSLVNADIIQNLLPGCIIRTGDLIMYNFPYGYKIGPKKDTGGFGKNFIHIAVVHEYRCIKGKSFPQAPDEAYLRMNEKNLIGYDIIVYGDNHKGFMTTVNIDSTIFNCGTLMRRKSDEVDYKPWIGLLLESGELKPHYLDIIKDKYLDVQTKPNEEDSLDMKAFIKELEKLGDTDLDFSEAMKQYLKKNKINTNICNIIFEAMGL